MVSNRVCVVRFGQHIVAVPGAYARQILSLTELRRAPRTPSTLLGLFAVRSQVIPIVILEPLLGFPVIHHDFAMQIEFEKKQFGFAIDAALGFINFESAVVTDAKLDSICAGAILFEGQSVPLLSLPKLMRGLSSIFAPQSPLLLTSSPLAEVLA
jgi:chemotaxis signal transduction protein